MTVRVGKQTWTPTGGLDHCGGNFNYSMDNSPWPTTGGTSDCYREEKQTGTTTGDLDHNGELDHYRGDLDHYRGA